MYTLVWAWHKNDQEAYELGVSKAFKPIMENTLKYLNVGKSKDDTSNAEYSKVPDVEGQDKQKLLIMWVQNH